MTDIRSKIYQLYTVETLAQGDSCVHKLHPLSKMIVTFVFVVSVVSIGNYDFLRLAPFVFYPIILMALSDTPFLNTIKKALPAMLFCAIFCVSNIIVERDVLFKAGSVSVTYGAASSVVIILKTLLSVSAVILLVSVTPIYKITGQLNRMKVPTIFTTVFEMTYRYIVCLLEEAHSTVTAYKLRSNGEKGIKFCDFKNIIGSLFIRSVDRAERVYSAMKCRGYGLMQADVQKEKLKKEDWIFITVWLLLFAIFRFLNPLSCVIIFLERLF